MALYMTSTAPLGATTGRGSGQFDIALDGRITAIRVWSGIYVDALEFQIDGARWTPKIGGRGGKPSTLNLSRGENIRSVEMRSGAITDSIKFTTSSGRTLSAGGRGGFRTSSASFNGRICRINGTANTCNGCYVIQNMAFHYTAGNYQTPDEQKQEREAEEARREDERRAAVAAAQEAERRARQQAAEAERRRREEDARRQQEVAAAQRRAAEAERQRRQAEALAQKRRQEAKAADDRRRAEIAIAQQRAADAQRSAIRSRIQQIDSNILDVQRELAQAAQLVNQRRGELNAIQTAIDNERAQLSELSQERIPVDTKVIVLLGMTGDGKSTLGNRLCGDASEEGNDVNSPFRTSRRGDSETEVQKCMSQIYGQKLCIVDTPGLDDSGGRDREHCNKLIHYLRGCGGVNQFFLVKTCANPRISGTFRSMLTRFEAMVGREFWQYVTVILTGVEGRHVGRMDEYREDLVDAVSKAHGCPPVNVVGIGFDDGYQETIHQLVAGVVPAKKFQCVALTSPVDELEAQAQIVAEEARRDSQKEDEISRRLSELQRQKAACENELRRV